MQEKRRFFLSHRVTESPGHRVTKSPGHQVAKSMSKKIRVDTCDTRRLKSTSRQVTKSPSHQVKRYVQIPAIRGDRSHHDNKKPENLNNSQILRFSDFQIFSFYFFTKRFTTSPLSATIFTK